MTNVCISFLSCRRSIAAPSMNNKSQNKCLLHLIFMHQFFVKVKNLQHVIKVHLLFMASLICVISKYRTFNVQNVPMVPIQLQACPLYTCIHIYVTIYKVIKDLAVPFVYFAAYCLIFYTCMLLVTSCYLPLATYLCYKLLINNPYNF